MSRLTFASNMRILDENSVVARYRGKEDAAIAKQPGAKKKALADVANTINQKAAEGVTPKKVGINLPLKTGQLTVFKKSNTKLDPTPLSKSSRLLLHPTKKKLNIKEKVFLGKDNVKKISGKPVKDVKLTNAIETVTAEIQIPNKAGNSEGFNLQTNNNEKKKPIDVATAVHVDCEEKEEAVEEFGCNHCSELDDDNYYDILPECLQLTTEQITSSAMCWEPKPKPVETKKFNMPLLPDAAIVKQPGVKKKALANVENTINQKDAVCLTPKNIGTYLPLRKTQFTVFEKSDKKLDTTPLSKSSKLILQPTKKKLNIKEKVLLGKDNVKQISGKPVKDVKMTKAIETVAAAIQIPYKAGTSEGFNLKKDNNEKPIDIATVVYVDCEDEENAVEEFGCSHCSELVDDNYYDILPECLQLTTEQIMSSAMCWKPKPKPIKKKMFNMPLLPEPPVYDPEDLFELDDLSLSI